MAATIHLSIPGIPGESTDINFTGTLSSVAYAWGLQNPTPVNSGSGAGGLKTTFQPLGVTKTVDRASPLLMQALTQGRKIPAMTLLISAAGGGAAPFLVYQFQTVLVSAIFESGSGDIPSESIQFSFGVYRLSYRTTTPPNILGTPVTSAWSVLTNSVPGGPAPH